LSPKMSSSKTSPVVAPAGRVSTESQRSMPSRPSSAVVTVSAPILEKTSFSGLKKYDVVSDVYLVPSPTPADMSLDGQVSTPATTTEQMDGGIP